MINILLPKLFKHKLIFLLLFLSIFKKTSSQVYTIGTGSGTQAQPLGILWGYMRSAMIFTPSNLGNTSGNVTAIAFEVSTKPTNNIPVVIYMKHRTGTFTNTTATTVSSEISGATQVFSGTILSTNMTNNTYYTINLTTPFSYNGTSNLEVIVYTNYGGSGGGSSSYKYTTDYTSVSPGVWYHQTWMADTNPPTGNGSISSSRPNTKITIGNPLPVSLLNFNANCVNKNVKLNWQTASELNNDYFDVERSNDGNSYASLLRLNGNGTTNEPHQYFAYDEQPLAGINYYRLKQVDFNGSTTYYNPVMVNCADDTNVSVYPNPNNGSFIVSGISDDDEIQLTDALGRNLFSKKGEINYELNNLQEGIYFVIIKNKFGVVQTQKIVVQK